MPSPPYLLPASPHVSRELERAVRDDYARFAKRGPRENLDEYLLNRYGLDLHATYGGYDLRNPWGKASGQLSMTAAQVAEDVEAGLAFIVLKTVIAQDENGERSMNEWAVKESRMAAEQVVGASGENGWTVSWKGRGWWQSFDDYLQLVRDARQIADARQRQTLIVPSCKFHLPANLDEPWKKAEYEATTAALLTAWRGAVDGSKGPMPLEKDFSPTLAGSDRSQAMPQILDWLRNVCCEIRFAAAHDPLRGASGATSGNQPTQNDAQVNADCGPTIAVGLKLFNTLFDDEFQLEMLRTIHREGPCRPDYFVYGNRLFDPRREFDGHKGIAFGGPDLSDRNLRVMTRFQNEIASQSEFQPLLPWSATGNITSGKMAIEYALRGASSFQLHTFFQLPGELYAMKAGNRTQKVLHELTFHPETGLIVWLHHLAGALGIPADPIRFRDCVGRGLDLRREP